MIAASLLSLAARGCGDVSQFSSLWGWASQVETHVCIGGHLFSSSTHRMPQDARTKLCPYWKWLKVLALTVRISILYLLEEEKITELQAMAVVSGFLGSPLRSVLKSHCRALRLNGKETVHCVKAAIWTMEMVLLTVHLVHQHARCLDMFTLKHVSSSVCVMF